MRAWALGLMGAAAVVIAALAAAAAVFLARPELFLSDRTVGAGLKRFGAAYAPRWSRLSFSADSLGSRRHRYVLRAGDLCFDDPAGSISACFSELEIAATVFFSRRGPVVERVERLVAVARTARIDLRGREPRPEAFVIPRALRGTTVDSLRIDASSVTFTSSAAAVSGGFRAVLASEGRRPLAVSADVLIRREGKASRLKAELTADTDLLKGGKPTFIDFAGRAEYGGRGRARGAFRVRREALRYTVSGGAEVYASGPVRSFRLTACAGTAAVAAGAERPSRGEAACRWELVPSKPAAGLSGTMTGAAGRLSMGAGTDGERYDAFLKATLDPVVVWGALAGNLSMKAEGSLDRPLKEASVSHELRASAQVTRFEDLVAYLRDTSYSVPAPIHVLKGPLALSLESRGGSLAKRVTIAYVFSSDLAGPRQRLITRAKGELTAVDALEAGRSLEHTGELILKEVALELPRLDIGRAPKVFSDGRIKTGEEKPAAAAGAAARPGPPRRLPPLLASLVVKTEKPLILFSNLAKDPVPIALDLVATYPPPGAAGTIGIQKFNVELFRRNATVDHLNVALSKGSKVGALEGLVRYTTPEAAIKILILGTTEKPRIEFVSVPPMKRDEIIGLLIFGKRPGELDPDQTASVGNTETALESRAFGLASLYLFGATPIEHVGYDSATKTTSVKLRLPGGANLTLGTDAYQNRQLSVRKPLAPHWAIQSEFTGQGQESKAAATFLEWFNRY